MRFLRTRLRAIWTVARGRPCAYRLNFEDGVLVFSLRDTRGAYVAECVFHGAGPTFNVNDGEYHHVALNRSGGTWATYVDGEKVNMR